VSDTDTVMGDTVAQLVPNMAGSALRKAREGTGMSVEDVAAKLKLSARQVLAIEAEDWKNLPERTFTRGFFYSYARLVGVDRKVIDTSFTQRAIALGEMRTLPAGIGEVTDENTSAPNSVARWVIPIALLAALAGGIAWFLWKEVPMPQANSKLSAPKSTPSSKERTTNSASTGAGNVVQPQAASPAFSGPSTGSSSVSTSSQNDAIAQKDGAMMPVAGGLLANTQAAATAAKSGEASAANAPSSAFASATTPSVAEATGAVAMSPAASSKPLAAGERRIVVAASGRSWTEARGDRGVLLSEMLSDTSREFVAKGPVSMVIGSSSNVKVTVDGKPYDFSMHVRNEVARFRIE
jgi:cytoskeleton protein RodZ